jgi:hypothetical protein
MVTRSAFREPSLLVGPVAVIALPLVASVAVSEAPAFWNRVPVSRLITWVEPSKLVIVRVVPLTLVTTPFSTGRMIAMLVAVTALVPVLLPRSEILCPDWIAASVTVAPASS